MEWNNYVTNIKVLERASQSIESLIIKHRLLWSGHVARMEESSLIQWAQFGGKTTGVGPIDPYIMNDVHQSSSSFVSLMLLDMHTHFLTEHTRHPVKESTVHFVTYPHIQTFTRTVCMDSFLHWLAIISFSIKNIHFTSHHLPRRRYCMIY